MVPFEVIVRPPQPLFGESRVPTLQFSDLKRKLLSSSVGQQLEQHARFTCFGLVVFFMLILLMCWGAKWISFLFPALFIFLTAVGIHDLLQTRHSVLRNYPVIGHLRFILEAIRPELRQYFFESDTDAIPFSRQQRAMVYARSKQELDKRAFGTQLDTYAAGYEWINHSIAPSTIASHDFRITIGRGEKAYSASVFNISAMSFGSLSANAILALNKGAQQGRFAHDTGEGSISAHHRVHGGDLIWEVASGYFGCRDAQGHFSPEKFQEAASSPQVKMIEVKLSQGAKPGHGGVLPAAKVTPEIAAARGVPVGVDCVSPASHSEFSNPVELLLFIERLRKLSGGKPTGFKFAMGHPWEWFGIAKAMRETGITPDFIVIDGKEGGTGAAPAEFLDRVGTPMREGLMLVHNTLVGLNLRDRVKIGVAGKIVSAFDVARVMALGADWCNSARGFMFAIGCIQSQSCHTGTCPTGVTTQDPLRQKALVVPDKAERVYNFHQNTLKALAELVAAAGLQHPSDLKPFHIVQRSSQNEVKTFATSYPFLKPGALLEGDAEPAVFKRFWAMARADSFAPNMAGNSF
jgi:glutamate synthase domain-containing protein 2